MEIEKFRSGAYQKHNDYRYFLPETINHAWRWSDIMLNKALEGATHKLGMLEGLIQRMPQSLDRIAHTYLRKEATHSSRIEGTQTELIDALFPEEEVPEVRRADWYEVMLHLKTAQSATEALKTLPISGRFMRNMHKSLMRKQPQNTPGEFRRSQNWIGGSTLKDAIFVPPVPEEVPRLMGDLEKFLHNDKIQVPYLIRIGLAHYQFETIHPFLDGNGRIGRLLIVLYLISKNLLSRPILSFSKFCEKDKDLYYNKLSRVRSEHDLLGWLKYFLAGIQNSAQEAYDILEQTLHMQSEHERLIAKQLGRRSNSAYILYKHLFKQPYLQAQDAAEICQISHSAATKLLKALANIDVLHRFPESNRPIYYLFKRYYDILLQE